MRPVDALSRGRIPVGYDLQTYVTTPDELVLNEMFALCCPTSDENSEQLLSCKEQLDTILKAVALLRRYLEGI